LAHDAFQTSYQSVRKDLAYWAKLIVENFKVSQGGFEGKFEKEINFYLKK
jgi:hypothetical protein